MNATTLPLVGLDEAEQRERIENLQRSIRFEFRHRHEPCLFATGPERFKGVRRSVHRMVKNLRILRAAVEFGN